MPAFVQASPGPSARVVLFQNSHSTPSGKKPNGTDLKIILVPNAGLNTEKQLLYVPAAITSFRDSFLDEIEITRYTIALPTLTLAKVLQSRRSSR